MHAHKLNKILFINILNSGSTGNICKNIADFVSDLNYDTYFLWGINSQKTINENECINSYCNNKLFSKLLTRITLSLNARKNGDAFGSKILFNKTKKIINKINPSIVHIHNIHGGAFNLPSIIKYCEKHNIPIVYTMHDCWPFTGYCPHFLISGCNKYLTSECNKCNYLNKYPLQKRDLAHKCYLKKYKAINSYDNITFVGVSNWISELAKKAPITKNHKIITIHNGIDTNIFKKTINKEVFKQYNVPFNNNYIICVSSSWYEGKGIQYLKIIAKKLSKEKINLLIVGKGLNEYRLTSNAFIIKQTKSVNDLASLYSMASITINPTLEDNFPNVILESIACHTPVVSFDTGGCKEAINGAGIIVPRGDIDKLIEETIKLFHNNSKDKFIYKPFIASEQYKKYLDLYNELLKEKKNG